MVVGIGKVLLIILFFPLLLPSLGGLGGISLLRKGLFNFFNRFQIRTLKGVLVEF
jgi:hypothetical protein